MGRSHGRNSHVIDELVGLNNLSHVDKSMIVVALPSPDDLVRKISSEKEPHLTLLYLGDPGFDQKQIELIADYVGHAASLICQFQLEVESRGVLGDKDADVLFFDKRWSKEIQSFRTQLLRNDLVSKAYLSTDQFPEWTPHLTLGYPTSPAKKFPEGFDRIYGVNFDRIALWTGDYSGPTFQLKRQSYDMEVAMSQTQRGRAFVTGASLNHYGVKGMHWGVRKDRSDGGSGSDSKTTPKPKMSEDAKNVERAFAKINRGGTDALSNQELQHLVSRLNLEQQYSRLTTAPTTQQKNALDRGNETVKTLLGYGGTYNEVRKFMKSDAGQALKKGFKFAAAGVKIGAAAYTGGASGAAAAGASIAVRRMSNHYSNVGR